MLNALDIKVELPRTPASLLFVDDGFVVCCVSILFIEVLAPPAAFGDCIDNLRFYEML